MNIRKTPSSWIVTHLRGGRLSARILPLLLLLLLFAEAGFAQSAGNFVAVDEQEIVRLVNKERQSRGLAAVVPDERMRQAARKHSQRMAAHHEIEHQLTGEPRLSLRLGETGLHFDTSGENVGFTANVSLAHIGFMNSPGHRANVLEAEFNSIGVGVLRTDKGIYITEDFARVLQDASVDQAEEQVATSLNRLRRAAGVPILRRLPAPDLRRQACRMAANDKLNPNAGLSLFRANHSVAFTAADLAQVSQSVNRFKANPASGFSVGACYQASATYDNPVFWIVVVTYF